MSRRAPGRGWIFLLICTVTVLSAVIQNWIGSERSSDTVPVCGAGFGLAACLSAPFAKGRWTSTLSCGLALGALALGGPVMCFLFFFGLFYGLGASMAAMEGAAEGQSGEILRQAFGLAALAAVSGLFFVSQGWVVARCCRTWFGSPERAVGER